MNRSQPITVGRFGGAAAVIAALLLSLLALGVLAQRASAVAVIYSEVAEEWAEDHAEEHCQEDGPYCQWGGGARCRQQGKFQVTCLATADYENEATEEYWDCHRRIRYTADKRAWHVHKRFVPHTEYLGLWTCEAHHTRPQA